MWVREQCMDALFMEDRSKVAATVHVPYMNSSACWGKRREKKKKKKGKTQKLKTQQKCIQTMPKYRFSFTYFFLMLQNIKKHKKEIKNYIYTSHFNQTKRQTNFGLD